MALAPTRQTLGNGVTAIVQENHTTPAVWMLAALNAGGYDDPPGREGTATLAALMIDRGTTSRTADQLADALDGRGASLSVSAGRHQVQVAATCLTADFEPVLAILADVIGAPVFPEDDLVSRRGELVTTIREEDDDPASVAVAGLLQAIYAGHPYARRVRGTIPSVEGLTRDDLVRFHDARLSPAGLTLVIVGSLPRARMLASVSRVLEGAAVRTVVAPPAVPEAPPATGRRIVRVTMPGKSQADLAYGFAGIRRSDPDYMAASVMNNVLGQYALGGRLGDSIRERQGMAYYAYSSLDAGLGPGPLMVRAGVAGSNVERTIASIDAELSAVRREGFTEKEVADSRQYMIGSLPRQLETSGGIASFLLSAELHGLGLDYDQRLPELLRGVTRDAAVAAALRLLDPDRAAIVVAGPDAESA